MLKFTKYKIVSNPQFDRNGVLEGATLIKKSHAKTALSVKKIRERILSFLKLQDLLQLRLVSREWRQNATNEVLLKRKGNEIAILKTMYGLSYARSIFWETTFVRPLEELSCLLNTTGSTPFPCSNFSIYYQYIDHTKKDYEIEKFLSDHGAQIKNLKLMFGSQKAYDEITTMNGILLIQKYVTKILLEQTPNLERLKLMFDWEFGGQTCELLVKNYNVRNSENTTNNAYLKLRRVVLKGKIPQSIFECIWKIAPNLEEICCGLISARNSNSIVIAVSSCA